MRIRSSFLGGALALLATFAVATPSQAGSVLVEVHDSIFVLNSDFYSNTITSVALTFTGLPNSIIAGTEGFTGAFVNSMGSQPVMLSLAGDTITLSTASPGVSLVAGTVTFFTTVPSGDVGDLTNMVGVSGVVTTSTGSLSNSLSFSSVPEPTSMALLGIGMTSFLAFRRFFKRTPIA
jgi:hypothetical protein